MSALVTSIVESDAGERLTTAQVQALVGLCTATVVPMSPSHTLFTKLSATIASLSCPADALSVLHLSLLLSIEESHRDALLEAVETHHSIVQALATTSMAALTEAAAEESGGAAAVAVDDHLRFLSLLVLVLLTTAEGPLKAGDLIEFISGDARSTVRVLVFSYGSVCGALPGVSPLVAPGPFQEHLATSLMEVMRQLIFWTTFQRLKALPSGGTSKEKGCASATDVTPMSTLANHFRLHVDQIAMLFIAHDLFSYMCVFLSHLAQRAAGLHRGDPHGAALQPLWEIHFDLLHGLLTRTSERTGALSKALGKTSLLSSVCASLMEALSPTKTLSPAAHPTLTLCVSVAATLSYRNGAARVFWENHANILHAVAKTALAVSPGSVNGEHASAKLIAQVVRLVVNSKSLLPVPFLRCAWGGERCPNPDCRVLSDADRYYVARALSNPKLRGRPLDIDSPSYDALNCIFCLRNVAPLTAAPQRGDSPDLLQQQDLGGGGRRRRGRRRPHRRGRGALRRARRQERHRLLLQRSTAAATGVDDELTQHLLESLDIESDSTSSQSISGTGGDAGSDAEIVPLAIDLSPWRQESSIRSSIPMRYICSLSLSVIRSSPVLSPTGYYFDEDVILDYLQHYQVCPITGAPLSRSDLVVDTELKEELDKLRSNFL